MRQRDPYRIKTLEQHLEGLKADRKQFELRRDQWQLNLNTALSRSAEVRKPGQLPSSGKKPLSAKQARKQQSASPSRAHRRNARSRLNYRSELKRVVALQFARNPKASALEICRALDSDGAVELPENWRTGENRLFELAYKDPRKKRKVEIMISKVRNEMRKNGLLS